MRKALIPLSFLALASIFPSARAADAYNNLDPGPDAYAAAGYVATPHFPLAFRFLATATGRLTGFTAALKSEYGDLNPFTVAIYADGPDETVGARIASGAGATPYYSLDLVYDELVEAPILAGPTLSAGNAYWVEVEFSNWGNWAISNHDVHARERFGGEDYYGSGPYYLTQRIPAFSVQIAPVPEPAPLAALGLGALALLRRLRARR